MILIPLSITAQLVARPCPLLYAALPSASMPGRMDGPAAEGSLDVRA